RAQGATRATRLRPAIHACTHRSALPSCRVPQSHASCVHGRRQGGTHQEGRSWAFSRRHIRMLTMLPEVVELPTSIVYYHTSYSLSFAHRLHVISVTTV